MTQSNVNQPSPNTADASQSGLSPSGTSQTVSGRSDSGKAAGDTASRLQVSLPAGTPGGRSSGTPGGRSSGPLTGVVGLHHVTAITTDARQNADFYARLLGLRGVKRTVNFDNPTESHLYYGDATGGPGSLLTFFVIPGLRAGRVGVPQCVSVMLSAPAGAQAFWVDRLNAAGVTVTHGHERLGEAFIRFHDPDGLPLEIVFTDADPRSPHTGEVPADHAVRGLYGVALAVTDAKASARHFTDALGWQQSDHTGARRRFGMPGTPVTPLDGSTASTESRTSSSSITPGRSNPTNGSDAVGPTEVGGPPDPVGPTEAVGPPEAGGSTDAEADGPIPAGHRPGPSVPATAGAIVDLIEQHDYPRGTGGAGTVHHVAFRLPDDAAQSRWRDRLLRAHLNVSPVMDRMYFNSIYYHEPGGVLFELATDTPGMTLDEPAERLGQKLSLPPQYEAHRKEIEALLMRV